MVSHFGSLGYCWTSNRPACSKIEGGFKSQSIEIYWSEQRAGLSLRPTSHREPTTKNHSHRTFIISVHVGRLLIGYQIRPTSISFFVLQLLQNNMWLSPPFSFYSLINWYQTLNCYVCVWGYFPTSPWYRMFSQCVLLCFLCACSFFKLPLCGFSLHTRLLTHTHPIPQCTKKHISYSS